MEDIRLIRLASLLKANIKTTTRYVWGYLDRDPPIESYAVTSSSPFQSNQTIRPHDKKPVVTFALLESVDGPKRKASYLERRLYSVCHYCFLAKQSNFSIYRRCREDVEDDETSARLPLLCAQPIMRADLPLLGGYHWLLQVDTIVNSEGKLKYEWHIVARR